MKKFLFVLIVMFTIIGCSPNEQEEIVFDDNLWQEVFIERYDDCYDNCVKHDNNDECFVWCDDLEWILE